MICDNYSPHKRAEVRAWARANDVELVYLPIYGSWLNWIESVFAGPAVLRIARYRPP
ncbi:transposase [Spongiactinospora sp. 9N601]|uniref:transposase n=1 Tax=Spongiactinospora sp. 9N601 TaxID=3375149 RepID=UPI0037B3103E